MPFGERTAEPEVDTTTDWAPYWIVRLTLAVVDGDHAAAAHAQLQLRRLGLDCKLRLLPRAEASRA